MDEGVLSVSLEGNKTLVRRAVDEFFNGGNLDAADQLYASDFANHNAAAPNVRTLEDLKQWTAARNAAFPDQRTEIGELVAEGDKVLKEWTWRGTHRGTYFGIAPTGRQVTIRGMTLYRIAGSRIVECWWAYDNLGVLRQLGVVATAE